MIRCDAEGIPTLVQRLRYKRSFAVWQATYFDGRRITRSRSEVTPHLGLETLPEEAEYLDAEAHFARLFFSGEGACRAH